MAFITQLFGVFLKTLLDSVTEWFKSEQAEAAKWAAQAKTQQLESIKAGQEKEREFQKAIDISRERTLSASAWNAGLALICCFLLSGCFRFYVSAETYRPVPPLVERPVIPEEPELTQREQILMGYALALEAAYKSVRADTIQHNEKAGFPTPEK